jgi:outer membrane lipoprotein-sorting protein
MSVPGGYTVKSSNLRKETPMRSRLVMYIALGLVAAVALIVGIVAVAGADQANPLPAVSAPDLLAKMAQQDQHPTSISGDVSWQNNLLGDLSALTGSDPGVSAKLPLAGSGSGRLWMSDAGARVESQAGGGDQTVVANSSAHDVWLYDYAANTARHVVTTGTPPDGAGTPAPAASPAMATPAAISSFLQQVAPYAEVTVTGQGVVAGRDVYFLTMTPTASDTALGSVQASIDGQTFVPLQLQVSAKGDPSPVLQFGFTKVSYDAVPASTFGFSPPAGTKVTTKTVDLSQVAKSHQGEPTKAQKEQMQSAVRGALLTVPEAQKLVPFQLASAQGYTARPFDWAAVVGKNGPLNALDQPVMQLLGATGMSGLGTTADAPAVTTTTSATGPTAVLLYGKGFGTIALAETATTPALQKQLQQLPALVDKTSVNGVTVRSLTTPLGGVFVWQQGDTTLVAGGMVPKADLEAFVTSVR